MPENKESLLEQMNTNSKDRRSLWKIVTSLSLVVVFIVFWNLKLTGIGIAGEAFCGKQEHAHSASCVEKMLICTQEETTGHTHTDACYEITKCCQLEEHTHIESCYSDITADMETSDDWEMTLADMVRGPTTRANVVLVAQSQLGYTESELNFQVDAQGVRRGITRYGQWYGNPYGDWSAMFASFCLYYAGAEDLPTNAGPEAMRLEWEAAGLYTAAPDGTAEPGNLLFLDKTENEFQSAGAVAVITRVSGQTVTVIQGDLNNTVAEAVYEITDPAILGYGVIPESSSFTVLVEPPAGTASIAATTNYSTSLISDTNQFVFYTQSGGNTYAIDGNGNAVQVYIGDDGNIYTDLADPNLLLWSITSYSSNAWAIQNVSTGRHLHPFYNSSTDNGIITPGRWGTTINAAGTGVTFSHSAYVGTDLANGRFQMVRNQSQNTTFQVGITQRCTVWLDGTDGGLGHLTGSPDVGYTVSAGQIMQLPTEWTSPSKYSYKLRGWYDVVNARYYLPGEEMTVTGNTVLYADWVASTYDIGQFNAQVADTVSTNSFITTHMFDYNYLFNVQSSNAQVTVNNRNHAETWSMVTSGSVNYDNAQTLNYIFAEADNGGQLSNPNNRSNRNRYQNADTISAGICTPEMQELLYSTGNAFDPATGKGVIGKTYLGTADHLFQIMDDPSDEHYGYYYYDSLRNALSYNQSNSRFYVYEYLSATSDAIGGSNADFLPFNSPYANTNGKTVRTYTYNGHYNEYGGVTHYRYDTSETESGVYTEFAYGMRSDIKFFLPNDPGSGGNKDLNGNDIQFQFSGDDDLWVLIDGQLVLDIGGIHQRIAGDINFSTGQVTVNGRAATSLQDLGITSGDHTLTVLYLERGASMSNCSIYFNLVPRVGLELKKEDVLTQEPLDGTQFTVYEDFECTQPAELWVSEDAYNQDFADGQVNSAQSTFSVINGVAKIWGLGAGSTYYIKENGPPEKAGYGIAQGVIRLTIDKDGQATYHVDVVADAEGNEPSTGYTVHGVRIDETTQTVYIVVTNAPEEVLETTTVQVIKKWEDSKSHSGDYIQAYLTVTDPDGTVRRIREITLSDENNWMYTWTNLPKYNYKALTEINYGVEESYESGYYSTVRRITQIEISSSEWAEAGSFVNGETYILKHSSGCLSTNSSSGGTLKWVDEATAKNSPLALWTATVSGSTVKFTNGAGQTLTLNYGSWGSSNRYFHAVSGNANYQDLTPVDTGSGFRFYATRNRTNHYMSSSGINSSGRIPITSTASSALVLVPMKLITQTDIQPVRDWAYQITNTPLAEDNETSMTVVKNWDVPEGYDSKLYQEFAVTVRLLANGVNTGRTVTLNLKNNWQGVFLGLPYTDDNGNVIQYTVEEIWERTRWTTEYGQIQTSGSDPPTYSIVITNTYYEGGPLLPATGSPARLIFILCGFSIMLGSLVYGIVSRRKRERRVH